jgi:hypothetical protein
MMKITKFKYQDGTFAVYIVAFRRLTVKEESLRLQTHSEQQNDSKVFNDEDSLHVRGV